MGAIAAPAFFTPGIQVAVVTITGRHSDFDISQSQVYGIYCSTCTNPVKKMSSFLHTVLVNTAVLVGGIWVLKTVESARNLSDFLKYNPRTAAAIMMVSGKSDSALRKAAFLSAQMRNPGEVFWQELWSGSVTLDCNQLVIQIKCIF